MADGEKADDADDITEGLPVPAWAAAIPFRSHRQFTSYMLEREAAWRSQYEQLCNKPVSMNAKDFVSESPMDLCGSPVGMGLSLFHCACLVGRTEVVKECLLGSKLDPNLLAYVAAFSLDAVHRGKGDTGSDAYALPTITGLELAAAANHGDVCSVLLSSGALVGRALHIAVTNGSVQAATAIISSFREGKNDLVLRRLTNGVMERFPRWHYLFWATTQVSRNCCWRAALIRCRSSARWHDEF